MQTGSMRKNSTRVKKKPYLKSISHCWSDRRARPDTDLASTNIYQHFILKPCLCMRLVALFIKNEVAVWTRLQIVLLRPPIRALQLPNRSHHAHSSDFTYSVDSVYYYIIIFQFPTLVRAFKERFFPRSRCVGSNENRQFVFYTCWRLKALCVAHKCLLIYINGVFRPLYNICLFSQCCCCCCMFRIGTSDQWTAASPFFRWFILEKTKETKKKHAMNKIYIITTSRIYNFYEFYIIY